MRALLDHQRAGALADDEAIPIEVKRTAGGVGIVVAAGQRSAGVVAGHCEWRDARVRAAAHHGDGVAASNDLRRLADSVGAAGAGRADAETRALEAEVDGDLRGRHVAQRARDEPRADSGARLSAGAVDLCEHAGLAAVAGAHEYP